MLINSRPTWASCFVRDEANQRRRSSTPPPDQLLQEDGRHAKRRVHDSGVGMPCPPSQSGRELEGGRIVPSGTTVWRENPKMEITVYIPPHLNPLPNGEDFSRTNQRVPSAVIEAEGSGVGTRVRRHAALPHPTSEDLSAGVEIPEQGYTILKRKAPGFCRGLFTL